MPCTNAAKTRNPLKFARVPQTTGWISAVSRPKFTILWGHVEEISFTALIGFSAPHIWNSLPTNIREAQSLLTFRRHLKAHYFQSAFSTPSDPPANAPWFFFKISALYKSFTYLLTYLLTYRCLTSFFRLSIRALVAKTQSDKVLRWCPEGDFWRLFCVLHFQRAACNRFQTCILNSH